MLRYNIVYADPPWMQLKGKTKKCRPHQTRNLDYPTLSLNDIKTVLEQVDADILFLWTIDKFLFEAQYIAEDLGYRLHARFIWNKTNGVAPGFTVRYTHEYLLWMYGKPMLKVAKEAQGKFTTVFSEPSKRHSQKPEKAYEMIEELYPKATKLELFARKRRIGWDAWGNEVDSSIEINI